MNSVVMQKIVKKFGSFCANDNVDFTLKKGEIHALLGENGAGKTTLMNILYGIYAADQGSIFINEKEVEITSPRVAMSYGIGMVHQHFMLVPNFTVAENIALGTKERFWLKKSLVERDIAELSQKYGLKIDPMAKVANLSVGEQERVEIMKALYRKAEILILDEPTAVLTPQETEALFVVLRNLADNGVSIIIITHKLDEVMAITDRVTVLRLGKKVATVETKETTKRELAKMMVGHEVFLNIQKPKVEAGETILELNNVCARENDTEKLKNVSFSVRAGEIVGIAGVDGNGQSELARSIAGLFEITEGEILLSGEKINGTSVENIIKKGLSYIPEDRLKDGLIGDFSIEDNFIIQILNNFTKHGLLQKKVIKKNAERLIKEYDVRSKGPTQQAKLLSGGNQQKLIFARELERSPKLLLAVQPTRGLDIGAIEYVWGRINEAKKNGVAVLLISTELDEILTLSDRILVMYEGKIVGEPIENRDVDIQKLGLLMAGVEQDGDFSNAS
jgi:ABC-type uncharacterized transport system ATPase subunit